MGSTTWKPKLLTIADLQEKFVHIDPSNASLVTMLAQRAGVDVQVKEKPSLTRCPGMALLKKIRNDHQSADMKSHVKPRANLFGDDVQEEVEADGDRQDKKRKKNTKVERRTQFELAELRANAGVFKVQLDDGRAAWLKRPILANDEIVVQFDDVSLGNVFTFIIDHGITHEQLFAKRQYRASGVVGVWKKGGTLFNNHGHKLSDQHGEEEAATANSAAALPAADDGPEEE